MGRRVRGVGGGGGGRGEKGWGSKALVKLSRLPMENGVAK